MTMGRFTFGALYTRQVRDLHHRYGVTLRETKGFLESHFYLDSEDHRSRELIRVLNRFVAHLAALDAEEEAEEQRRRFERSGHWIPRFLRGQTKQSDSHRRRY